ncbi:MAG: hypothetical protein ACLU38_01365 [Dysosmobacter sp.]
MVWLVEAAVRRTAPSPCAAFPHRRVSAVGRVVTPARWSSACSWPPPPPAPPAPAVWRASILSAIYGIITASGLRDPGPTVGILNVGRRTAGLRDGSCASVCGRAELSHPLFAESVRADGGAP